MNKDDFYYLVTNASAIASLVFTVRCGEFGASASEDSSNEIPTFEFNLQDQLNNVDFQEVLNNGYSDIEAVESKLEAAWQELELDTLDDLLNKLPKELPNLAKKISGEELKQWIAHCAENPSFESFDILYQYIMNSVNKDEEIYDLIRASIASNDSTELVEEDAKITSKHIRVDDLVTAAEIESFSTFEWMFNKGKLNDEQKEAVLSAEGCIDDRLVFEQICKIMSPSPAILSQILEKADAAGHEEVVDFIKTIG